MRFMKCVSNASFQKDVSKWITKCVYNDDLQKHIPKYTFDATRICLN